MTPLPYDALGGVPLTEIHSRVVRRIFAMSRRFDQVITSGVSFRSKTSYAGVVGGDIVGDADEALQAEFLQDFPKDFEGWGMIAEEDNLQIEPTLVTPWGPAVMTLDPNDGTARLKRLLEDPHLPRGGVSIMIALKVGTFVLATYIFDLFTKELFFVNMGTPPVLWRQTGDSVSPVTLPGTISARLNEGTLLVHRGLSSNPVLAEWLGHHPSVFAQVQEGHSSIGLELVDAVLGNMVGLVRRPGGFFTPWDDTPMVGLYRAGHIHTFWIKPGGIFEEFVLEPPTQKIQRELGMLYLPARFVRQLQAVADVRLLSA